MFTPIMQLTLEQKSLILGLSEAGWTQQNIALKIGSSQATVSYFLKKNAQKKIFCHAGNNGRPSLFDNSSLALLEAERIKNPKISLRKVSGILKDKLGKNISYNTVRNMYNKNGIKAYSPIKKPLLTKRHVKARISAASQWLTLNETEQKSVIFSDESKFNLICSDGRQSVWREKGSGLKSQYLCPTIKHGGGSVMVWACFSYYGVGKLVFIEGKMDAIAYVNILSENLFASASQMGLSSFIFQQDNDPKHTSKLAKHFFEAKNISLLSWPAQSPDMNPIENLWAIIKAKIAILKPKSIPDLKTAIMTTWNEMEKDICIKLSKSFRKRTMALLRVSGNHTNY